MQFVHGCPAKKLERSGLMTGGQVTCRMQRERQRRSENRLLNPFGGTSSSSYPARLAAPWETGRVDGLRTGGERCPDILPWLLPIKQLV